MLATAAGSKDALPACDPAERPKSSKEKRNAGIAAVPHRYASDVPPQPSCPAPAVSLSSKIVADLPALGPDLTREKEGHIKKTVALTTCCRWHSGKPSSERMILPCAVSVSQSVLSHSLSLPFQAPLHHRTSL